jgi:hypothetical protein
MDAGEVGPVRSPHPHRRQDREAVMAQGLGCFAKPIDWDKPLSYLPDPGLTARFIARDGEGYVVNIGTFYALYTHTGIRVGGTGQVVLKNGPVTHRRWMALYYQDSVLTTGWYWSEKEARGYAGTGLVALREVVLTEGEK